MTSKSCAAAQCARLSCGHLPPAPMRSARPRLDVMAEITCVPRADAIAPLGTPHATATRRRSRSASDCEEFITEFPPPTALPTTAGSSGATVGCSAASLFGTVPLVAQALPLPLPPHFDQPRRLDYDPRSPPPLREGATAVGESHFRSISEAAVPRRSALKRSRLTREYTPPQYSSSALPTACARTCGAAEGGERGHGGGD